MCAGASSPAPVAFALAASEREAPTDNHGSSDKRRNAFGSSPRHGVHQRRAKLQHKPDSLEAGADAFAGEAHNRQFCRRAPLAAEAHHTASSAGVSLDTLRHYAAQLPAARPETQLSSERHEHASGRRQDGRSQGSCERLHDLRHTKSAMPEQRRRVRAAAKRQELQVVHNAHAKRRAHDRRREARHNVQQEQHDSDSSRQGSRKRHDVSRADSSLRQRRSSPSRGGHHRQGVNRADVDSQRKRSCSSSPARRHEHHRSISVDNKRSRYARKERDSPASAADHSPRRNGVLDRAAASRSHASHKPAAASKIASAEDVTTDAEKQAASSAAPTVDAMADAAVAGGTVAALPAELPTATTPAELSGMQAQLKQMMSRKRDREAGSKAVSAHGEAAQQQPDNGEELPQSNSAEVLRTLKELNRARKVARTVDGAADSTNSGTSAAVNDAADGGDVSKSSQVSQPAANAATAQQQSWSRSAADVRQRALQADAAAGPAAGSAVHASRPTSAQTARLEQLLGELQASEVEPDSSQLGTNGMANGRQQHQQQQQQMCLPYCQCAIHCGASLSAARWRPGVSRRLGPGQLCIIAAFAGRMAALCSCRLQHTATFEILQASVDIRSALIHVWSTAAKIILNVCSVMRPVVDACYQQLAAPGVMHGGG